MEVARLAEAVAGLRGWRCAGERYANTGGRIEQLDYQVDVALDEVEWQSDPESAASDDVDRPDAARLAWAMSGMRDHFGDGPLGEDLQTVCAFLEEPALFPQVPA